MLVELGPAHPRHDHVGDQQAADSLGGGRQGEPLPCVGGLPDVVVHRETGYLADPFAPEDLARGIAWALDDSRRAALGAAARERAVRLWAPPVVAAAHVALFEEIIDEARGHRSAIPGP